MRGGWIADVLLSRSAGSRALHRERPAVRRRRAEYLGVVICQMNGDATGVIILAARRCQGDFNAPVLRARFGSSVWRNRIAVAMPLCRDKFGLHALRNQILHNGVGALLRKLQV